MLELAQAIEPAVTPLKGLRRTSFAHLKESSGSWLGGGTPAPKLLSVMLQCWAPIIHWALANTAAEQGSAEEGLLGVEPDVPGGMLQRKLGADQEEGQTQQPLQGMGGCRNRSPDLCCSHSIDTAVPSLGMGGYWEHCKGHSCSPGSAIAEEALRAELGAVLEGCRALDSHSTLSACTLASTWVNRLSDLTRVHSGQEANPLQEWQYICPP